MDFPSGRSSRRGATGFTLGLILLMVLQIGIQVGEAVEEQAAGDGMRVVDKVDLFEPAISNSLGSHSKDGWLIFNPQTRRGYQIFRVGSEAVGDTAIWSFDLDTLKPLQRAVIEDFQVIHTGENNFPGDVVHAVDQEGGRIFLAGRTPVGASFGILRETQVAVIDERKLDQEPSSASIVRRMSVPISQQAQISTSTSALSLSFSRWSGAAKLLLLFGSTANTFVNNSWLAQWDPERAGGDHGDWIIRLAACQRSAFVESSGWRFQLEILRTPYFVVIACFGESGTTAVRFPLLANGSPSPSGTPSQDTFEVFPLPRTLANVLADQQGERLLVQTQFGGTSWWAFDARAGAWVGGAGETLWDGFVPGAGLDPATGRLYSLVPDHVRLTTPPQPVQGGFEFVDARLTPVPQLTNSIPDLAYLSQFRIWVDPAAPGRSRRIFVRRGNAAQKTGPKYPGTGFDTSYPMEDFFLVVEDPVPVKAEPSLADLDGNTVDVPEEAGITGAKFDAVGSGFGFRHLLTGGFQPVITRDLANLSLGPCGSTDRAVVIGDVESARLSNLSASAKSLSLSADESTKADLENPASRCDPGYFNVKLPSSIADAIDEAVGQKWDSDDDGKDDYTAQCSGDDGKIEAPTPKKLEGTYSSEAECDYSGSNVRSSSTGRLSPGGSATPISVMSASSTVTTKKAEDGGTIVEVDSIARGIEIDGVGSIGVVRSLSVARSAGRPGTARTSFQRFVCGVDMPGFKVTTCLTDDQQNKFIAELNRLLAPMRGKATLRNPDPELSKGTGGGYLAAVQRDRTEVLNDELLTRDSSKTVPGLEMIFYRGDSSSGGAARQVFQFASGQASSAYGIFCLFGQDDEGDCIRPTAQLSLSLRDDSDAPNPLEGGVFEVHADPDGDGLLGIDDPVVELTESTAVCQTSDDGTGNCTFELAPGNYIVHEATPPAGYAGAPDCAVTLTAWVSQTCNFVNLKAIGTVDILLTDDSPSPQPLEGGVFELYADDGDEALGATDLKLASCTTNAQGQCVFDPESVALGQGLAILPESTAASANPENDPEESEDPLSSGPEGSEEEEITPALVVPLGTYIVRQETAPPDYAAAADVSFALENPRDSAHLAFTNGLTAIEGTPKVPSTPATQGTPATSGTGATASGPGETTVIIEEVGPPPRPTVSTKPIPPPIAPNLVDRIISGPSEALKFLARNPKEAILFAGMWLIFVGPLWMVWRRRSLVLVGRSG